MNAVLGINMIYFLSKNCYIEDFENYKRKKEKQIIDINYKICLFFIPEKKQLFLLSTQSKNFP